MSPPPTRLVVLTTCSTLMGPYAGAVCNPRSATSTKTSRQDRRNHGQHTSDEVVAAGLQPEHSEQPLQWLRRIDEPRPAELAFPHYSLLFGGSHHLNF